VLKKPLGVVWPFLYQECYGDTNSFTHIWHRGIFDILIFKSKDILVKSTSFFFLTLPSLSTAHHHQPHHGPGFSAFINGCSHCSQNSTNHWICFQSIIHHLIVLSKKIKKTLVEIDRKSWLQQICIRRIMHSY
jgi:hypothetical protein